MNVQSREQTECEIWCAWNEFAARHQYLCTRIALSSVRLVLIGLPYLSVECDILHQNATICPKYQVTKIASHVLILQKSMWKLIWRLLHSKCAVMKTIIIPHKLPPGFEQMSNMKFEILKFTKTLRRKQKRENIFVLN